MKKESEFSQYFDDDFEVTYDEYMTDTDIAPRSRRTSGYRRPDPDTESWDMPDATEDYDNEDTLPGSVKQKKASKKRRSRGVPLAAPIRKGGRTLSRLASSLVRSLTAILILAVTVYVMWTFWRASTPYGDILEALETMKPSLTLLVYLCAALLFLLFELISLLWSMTRTRVRDGLALSYLAFLFSPFLPDAPEAVYGLKGALDVYGSMHNVLFGLCAAGVISCIVRKYFG